jgi:hypothetical protein
MHRQKIISARISLTAIKQQLVTLTNVCQPDAGRIHPDHHPTRNPAGTNTRLFVILTEEGSTLTTIPPEILQAQTPAL